ncbi:hypothetical protein QJS04_geneDACA019892 [Acorus gramineus]|uniref:Uncharacterized protein n=1 Tax=Acorus gramineus TaxID=55184 RepID=A0AAV9BY14_ACOGR|nr:hypothetical protein QJS04_geneDACA019892 [Acorus gramineus]
MATQQQQPPLPLPLAGRTAIVTGASRGIGRVIAVHLSSLGADLVINYASNAASAESLVSTLPRGAVTVRAGVSIASDVKALFDRAEESFGGRPAHVLVNCAGILDLKYPSVAHTAEEDWDRTFAVNAKGASLCCREAAARLARGGGGRIVAVTTSVVGSRRPGYGAYAASKAAVETMVGVMAKELKGTGITANCVAPGLIVTAMFFVGRLGEVGDVAPVVGFLATDGSGWINGQVIRVNGGYV